MKYSEAFKSKMVEKMVGPNGRSASALSEEVGVPQPTLSRWLKSAGTVPSVAKSKKRGSRRRRRASADKPKRPQDWKPAEKLQAVLETASLSEDELGEWLRKNGLHEEHVEQWRQQIEKAALEALAPRRRSKKPSPEQERIRELQKELRRKERALAETAALLTLKKKADAIWGVVDDDTDGESE